MLSEEQREFIENNTWIVDAVLRKLNQSHNEDLRQEGLLCLCKLVDKDIQHATWQTYAYKTIFFNLRKKVMEEQDRKKSTIVVEEVKYYKEKKSNKSDRSFIMEIYKKCTPTEQELIELYLDGYTTYEGIAREMGLYPMQAYRIMQNIKKKAKELERQQ